MQDANIAIRAATYDDAEAVAAIYRPLVTETTISFEEEPPDAQEMARRIAHTTDSYPWLVARRDGAIAGYAYAHRHRERSAYRFSVEVSVYVAQEARGKGIARALYSELFARLSERGFHNAFAGIALPNDASVALHERSGFVKIGVFEEIGFKFGRWIDVAWYQRPLNGT